MESELINIIQSSSWGAYVIAAYAVVGGIVTIASAIVPFTSTPKDDEYVGKIKSFLLRFSVLGPKK